MQTIPARITDLKTADEMAALRNAAATDTVVEEFDTATVAYSHRSVPSDKRHEQDGAALFHTVGGIKEYLRSGGDPAVAVIVQTALNLAAER